MKALINEKAALTLAGVIWALTIATGVYVLYQYAATPGTSGAMPLKWPRESAVPAPQNQPVLVMIAHPQCPCTRASLSELSKIMTTGHDRVKGYVLVLQPRGFADAWTKSDLWASANSIPGVTVLPDPDGREAHLFNVATSGHTLLYDRNGVLLFSGGITAARGHAGDNQGADLILSGITGQGLNSVRTTPVFGCPIFNK